MFSSYPLGVLSYFFSMTFQNTNYVLPLSMLFKFFIIHLQTQSFSFFSFINPTTLNPSPPRSAILSLCPTIQGKKKSNVCCPYTHWSMVKLPVTSPLKKTEPSPPTPLLEAISCGELHISTPITTFKMSPHSFLSGLLFLVGRGGRGCHTTVALQSSAPLQKQPPCSLQ